MADADVTGFEEWVVGRRPALLRTAFLLTGSTHEADDLVQTTLLKVVPRWSRVAADPEAYVRRVMVNANISRWQRRRWREVATAQVPDWAVEQVGSEDRLTLHAALARLAPRQRAVVVLRYYDDLTEREAADLLGVTVGTVKSQARDALARLRVLLPTLDLEKISEE